MQRGAVLWEKRKVFNYFSKWEILEAFRARSKLLEFLEISKIVKKDWNEEIGRDRKYVGRPAYVKNV